MTLLETFFPEISVNRHDDYNLVKLSDTETLLEFSVPGVSEDGVNVEVCGNTLAVTASTADDRTYLYRGLKRSQIERKLSLRDDVIVKSATVKNGILGITLEVQIPEDKKPRKIPIVH
jgi:molecular chaperone IbpA